MRTRLVFAAAAGLLAAGCNSPTESAIDGSELVFEYRLGGEGWLPYALSGSQPPGRDREQRGEWVHTSVNQERDNVFILAQDQVTNSAWLDFWLRVPVAERGDTIDLQPTEEPCDGGRPCTYAQLILNPTSAGGLAPEVCEIETGRLVLQSVSAEEVAATFSGTGTCSRGTTTRPFDVRSGALRAVLPAPGQLD
jgi:hypothetical protein